MKKFIKKYLIIIINLIVKLFSLFNSGRFIIENLTNSIFSLSYKVSLGKDYLFFYTPNRINFFRIDTFFTKEPETLTWIDNFKIGGCFFDIGANVGLYSCYAAKKSKANVFAFEPSAFNLELLTKNIYKNKLNEKITIVPIPLTNKTNIADFNMSSIDHGGAMSTFSENYTHDGTNLKIEFSYKILGTSLDDLIKNFNLPKPDYLKIDVDGIEHVILEGANDTLDYVKGILVEVNEDFELQNSKVKKILKNKGFKLNEKFQSKIIKKIYNQIWVK